MKFEEIESKVEKTCKEVSGNCALCPFNELCTDKGMFDDSASYKRASESDRLEAEKIAGNMASMKEELKESMRIHRAERALNFIVESNGGLTNKQVTVLQELIESGYIEAIDNYTLTIHN